MADLLDGIRSDQLRSRPHHHALSMESAVLLLRLRHDRLAFVIYFFLPDSPLSPGRRFTAEEKEILLHRFQENPYGKDRQPFKVSQLVEALTDFKTYTYFLMAAAIYVSVHMGRSAEGRSVMVQ